VWTNGTSIAGTLVLFFTAVIFLQMGTMSPVLMEIVWRWFVIPAVLGLVLWGIGFYQFCKKKKEQM